MSETGMNYLQKISEIVGSRYHNINIKQEDLTCSYESKVQQGKFYVNATDLQTAKETLLAYFTLVAFPGCCGILISTDCLVGSNVRRKGLGTLLNKMRIDIARKWGYSLLICTDVVLNHPQRNILSKNNWKELLQFVNKRTQNKVSIHVFDLNESDMELGFKLKNC